MKKTMLYIKSGLRPLFIAAKLQQKKVRDLFLYKDCKAWSAFPQGKKTATMVYIKFGQRPNFTAANSFFFLKKKKTAFFFYKKKKTASMVYVKFGQRPNFTKRSATILRFAQACFI